MKGDICFMNNKNKIKRLLYLEKELTNTIHLQVTEYLLRDKEIDTKDLKDGLDYIIDENLFFFNKDR